MGVPSESSSGADLLCDTHARAPRPRLALPALLAALALAVSLAACGESTVDPSSAEEAVTGVIADSGFEADDVSCPDDVEAKEGTTFECDFTGPAGPQIANVEITSVDGDNVEFNVSSGGKVTE